MENGMELYLLAVERRPSTVDGSIVVPRNLKNYDKFQWSMG